MGDIVSFGSDRSRRPPPRWLIVAGVIVVSAVVLMVFALDAHRGRRPVAPAAAGPAAPVAASSATPVVPAAGPPCPPFGSAQSPPVRGRMAGLLIDRATGSGSGLERCDRTAADGPWTVVVRRSDGSLGRHGAVVTFPVGSPPAGRAVGVGSVTGTATSGMVTWPVAGGNARIRGDLGEAELITIAARTTVVTGRPSVHPPTGYTVVATEPFRPPTIHEMRYASAAVGEQDALGDGLTYTGVTSGGGFEDQLYAVPTDDGGLVDGRPAVVSPVLGGNGTLAWEPAPGIVAYIGYSGSTMNGTAVAALHRLAGRARPLTGTEWQAAGPQIADQVNELG